MPKRGGSDNVYICVPRDDACRILSTLWVAVRNLPTDDRFAERIIMEDMSNIADAIDYYDKRHKARPEEIGRLVVEGLKWFDYDTQASCMDS